MNPLLKGVLAKERKKKEKRGQERGFLVSACQMFGKEKPVARLHFPKKKREKVADESEGSLTWGRKKEGRGSLPCPSDAYWKETTSSST